MGNVCAILPPGSGSTRWSSPQGLGDGGIRIDGDGGRGSIEGMSMTLWTSGTSPSGGRYDWGEDAGPSRTQSENHEWPWVKKARDHTDKPVMTVGRFTDPDTMSSG